MARRLPVYLLIDTSGSMKGEAIESVKVGVHSLISTLRNDPYALETVNISIITYDKEVKQIVPLTPIEDLQIPEIKTPDSGPTHMGAALEVLLKKLNEEAIKSTSSRKGDWMPLLFLMTDGKPSDKKVFENVVPKIKNSKFAAVVCCAAGPKAKTEDLHKLTNNVYEIETLDTSRMMKFFKWVSDIIGEGNRSMGATDEMALPPPPPEVNLVI